MAHFGRQVRKGTEALPQAPRHSTLMQGGGSATFSLLGVEKKKKKTMLLVAFHSESGPERALGVHCKDFCSAGALWEHGQKSTLRLRLR